MTSSTAFGHRGLVLSTLAIAILAFWTLTIAGSSVPNDEKQWHFKELKESAARNKQHLAHLLLDSPKSRSLQ